MSWTASMIMGMSTTHEFDGDFNFNFPTVTFPGPVTVDGEFTITQVPYHYDWQITNHSRPSMTVSIGIKFSADSAADFTGGGTVSVNTASMDLDFMAQTTERCFLRWS